MNIKKPKMAYVKCQSCRWSAIFPIYETREAFFLKAAEEHHNASNGCEEPLVVIPTARRKPPAGFRRGSWVLRTGAWNLFMPGPQVAVPQSVKEKLHFLGLNGTVCMERKPDNPDFAIEFHGFDAHSTAG